MDKNLHAEIDPSLLERVLIAAQDEHVTVDDFVADAIQRRLRLRELDQVLAFGKRHVAARGLTEADIEQAVADTRAGR